MPDTSVQVPVYLPEAKNEKGENFKRDILVRGSALTEIVHQ